MKIEFTTDDANDDLTNINVAKAIIEHESTYFNKFLNKEQKTKTFGIEDLEEIACHLLTYCRFEKIRNGFKENE